MQYLKERSEKLTQHIIIYGTFLSLLSDRSTKLLEVQISSVRFPKDGFSCYEWFTAFGGFRDVKHLLIIFSLYRFEFHKNLDFYCV